MNELTIVDQKLYRLSVRCSRCGHLWSVLRLDSLEPGRSNYMEFKNFGCCQEHERACHIDCLLGCSHPPILAVVIRTVLWPFTGRPIFGYGEIIEEHIEAHHHQVIMPFPDPAELVKIQVEGMREANKIIARAF